MTLHKDNEKYRIPSLPVFTQINNASLIRVNRRTTLVRTKDGGVYTTSSQDFDLLSPYNGSNREVRAAACKLLGVTQKSIVELRKQLAIDQAEIDRKHEVESLRRKAGRLGYSLELKP